MAERYGDKRFVQIASLSRIILFPLLIFCTILPSNGAILSAIILLGLIGLSWALFNVSSTTLSLQLVPKTKVGESSGIYYASTGLGSVLGSFLGGLLPSILWQSQQGIYIFFAASGILFIFPLYIFSRLKVSATSQHSKL
jgi:MFS family permease